ncbi:MAG: ABC transporter ATP-binding protein [Sarcina sp.]
MTVAIKVSNLTKVYKMYDKRTEKLVAIFSSKKEPKKFYALDNVSFEINRGECVGIIGHNGAGKSTLLKLLTGVAFPTSGTIEINGKVSSLLELGSGFNPELTGMENIYFNGSLNGLRKEDIDKKLKDIIDFANIGDFIYQPVKSYSSGMFARLAFAVAINIDPDILIVDEILSVGDVGFQVKCMEKFNDFKKRGKTILYVSHGLGTVKKFCDRAIWLQRGKVMDDGNSVIVVERYYNLNFNPANKEEIEEATNEIVDSVVVKNNSNKVKYFERLNMELEYIVKEAKLKNPYMILELRKTDYEPGTTRDCDQFVCSFDSRDSQEELPFHIGVNKVCFNIKKLNIMSGVYYFDCIIKENETEIFRKTNVYNFILDDKYRGEGFIVLEHSWIN